MIEKGLLIALGLLVLIFAVVFFSDVYKNWNIVKEEKGSLFTSGIIGFITNFFDTLGIGSFAPTTALLRLFKQIDDRVLPGTLNVACTIPVIIEAFLFIKGIKVESVTLLSMLLAATIGSYVGAGIVSKLPTKKVQLTMGIALLLTALIMLLQKLNLFPSGGSAVGLTGFKLIFAVVCNFILGALMTAGIGLYAPCMALVYLLGMSPAVAFPIMMGSCAFLMPVASMKFVKEGAYSKKVSLAISIFGVIGVYIAYTFVKSLDLNLLSILIMIVVVYTAIPLLMSAFKNKGKIETIDDVETVT